MSVERKNNIEQAVKKQLSSVFDSGPELASAPLAFEKTARTGNFFMKLLKKKKKLFKCKQNLSQGQLVKFDAAV